MHSFDTWDSWLNYIPNEAKLPVLPYSPLRHPLSCSLRVAKDILKKHNDTHHLEPSKIVHKCMVWVNNKTKKPCVINPCSICIRLEEIGLPIYNFVSEKETP